MATSPMPNPQASAPQPGADSAQANPLQTTLGKIAMMLKQIAQGNTSIQDPLNQAVQSIVQAIQMSSQAAVQPQQQPAAPQQQ